MDEAELDEADLDDAELDDLALAELDEDELEADLDEADLGDDLEDELDDLDEDVAATVASRRRLYDADIDDDLSVDGGPAEHEAGQNGPESNGRAGCGRGCRRRIRTSTATTKPGRIADRP